jgi:hypothetical protein
MKMRKVLLAAAAALSCLLVTSHVNAAVNTRVLMDQILPQTTMNDLPLKDAITYLRNVTGANIFVNWNVLQNAGISKLTPVSLTLQNVSARKTLSLILEEVSPQTPLIFYTHDNVLMVTTRSDANRRMVTRVYPVGDLVMTVPNFTNAPQFNLSNATQNSTSQVSSQGGGGIGNIGGGGSIFQQSSQQNANTTTTTDRAKALVSLVEDTIQPSIWTKNGGRASIVYFDRELVVNAPVYVQRMISSTGH